MKEICVTRADAGYVQHDSAWIVIRDDDARFAEIAAARPDEVRDVTDMALYGHDTAYDFGGPESGGVDAQA